MSDCVTSYILLLIMEGKKLVAMGNRIFVTQETPPVRTKSGILIPDSARRRKPIALVASVGSKVDGIHEGDTILMVNNNPEIEIEYDGVTYGIITLDQIECKITGDDIIPIGSKVVLIQDPPDEISEGGVLIPSKGIQPKRTGKVIHVGKDGISISPGDRVYFSKMGGKIINYNDIDYTLVEENDIQCIIDENGDIHPLRNMIIIKQDEINGNKASGIIINPMGHDHLKPNSGEILQMGEDIDMLKVGDRVCFSMYAGRKLEWKKKKYILMRQNEVQSIIPHGVDFDGGFTQDHLEMIESMGGAIGDSFDNLYGADRAKKLEDEDDFE